MNKLILMWSLSLVTAMTLVVSCSDDDDKKKKPKNRHENRGDGGDNKKTVTTPRSGDKTDDPTASNRDDGPFKVKFESGKWPRDMEGTLVPVTMRFVSEQKIDNRADGVSILSLLSERQTLSGNKDKHEFYVETCFDRNVAYLDVETSFHMVDDKALFLESKAQRVREYIIIYPDGSKLDEGIEKQHRGPRCVYTMFKFNEDLAPGNYRWLFRIRDRATCRSDARAAGVEEGFLGLKCNATFDDFDDEFDRRYDTVMAFSLDWQ